MVSMRRTITSSFISISNLREQLQERASSTKGADHERERGATPIVVGEKQHLWRAR
jgi:hypothetical protein